MSRYDNYNGSGTGNGNDNDFDDDTTIKLQKYAAVRLTPERVNFSSHQQYGDSLIFGFDGGAVLDGIVFQRDDKPQTWKVFGFGDLGFNVGPDGLVYEQYDAENDEFSGQMSASDILQHARVQGFSESFGGDQYFYTPVGVVVEEADDVAVNDEIDFETPEVQIPEIPVGEVSMLLGNRSWVRTLAKLLTEEGNEIVSMTTNGEGEEIPVSDNHGWLTTDDPTIREGVKSREVELFIIEETFNPDDGEEVTYTTPILLDGKTGERITIDNDVEELEASDDGDEADTEDAAEAEPVAATDGGPGATTETTSEPDTQTTDSPEMPDNPTEGLPADVPEVLDDLIDYFARTQGGVEADELREFAADEVDDADAVDWTAAAAEVESRA